MILVVGAGDKCLDINGIKEVAAFSYIVSETEKEKGMEFNGGELKNIFFSDFNNRSVNYKAKSKRRSCSYSMAVDIE